MTMTENEPSTVNQRLLATFELAGDKMARDRAAPDQVRAAT